MHLIRPIAAAAMFTLAIGCSSGSTPFNGTTPSTVHVLYAGSLVNLMEKQVGPAFAGATGDDFEGEGAASQALANEIKGHVKSGDVFISASPAVDATLTGPTNGDWVRWYATFATAPLVLGYSPKSEFATELESRPWYDVLRLPNIRIGMTDPTLDPKGKLTVAALADAERAYHLPAGYANAIEAKASVFPEEDLVGRLEAGQLDVGFFYSNEVAPADIPSVSLGKVQKAATFTVTVLEHSANPTGGAAFVKYLLTDALPTLAAGGMHLTTPALTGPASDVPGVLRPLIRG
jgi:molybdate/tungstate transport system substrate-binding protein